MKFARLSVVVLFFVWQSGPVVDSLLSTRSWINVHLFSSRRLANPTILSTEGDVGAARRTAGTITSILRVASDADNIEKLIIPPLTYSVFGDDATAPTVVKNKPLFARLVSWMLHRFVASRTQFVSGLEVNVLVPSNRHIIRGRIDTLELKFEKMIFAQLFVSGGGRVIMKNVDLRMRRFLFQNLQSIRKPYQIYGDFLLTQSDIVNSKLIRNLIQMLCNTILERAVAFTQQAASTSSSRSSNSNSYSYSYSNSNSNSNSNGNSNSRDANQPLQVVVKKVSIRARRIFAMGEVSVSQIPGSLVSSTAAGAMMPFEVSTGAGVRDDGHVLFLRDIQVVLNPDSNFRAVVPIDILLTSPIDVDLGEEFRLDSLVIANKHVWIRANSVISPVEPFQVTPIRSRALYRYDLAAFLSAMLKLQGGIAVPWRGGQEKDESASADSSSSNSEGASGSGRGSGVGYSGDESVTASATVSPTASVLSSLPMRGTLSGTVRALSASRPVPPDIKLYEAPGVGDFAANWDWLDTEGR